MGRHYDPAHVWIVQFDADSVAYGGITQEALTCEIRNDVNDNVVVLTNPPNQQFWVSPHGHTSSVTFTLTCWGEAGLPATVEVAVP